MKKNNYTSVYISSEIKVKIEELMKRDHAEIMKNYIEDMVDFFLNTNIHPKQKSVDIFEVLLKIEKDFSSIKKWTAELRNGLIKPIYEKTDMIVKNMQESDQKKQVEKMLNDNTERVDNEKEELKKTIEKLHIEIEQLEKSNENLVKGYSKIKHMNINLPHLIKTEKGMFNKKLYIDEDKVKEYQKEIGDIVKG